MKTDPRPPGSRESQGLGLAAVLQVMKNKGYTELTGPNKPGWDGQKLKNEDVIVMNGHIGFANGPNNISHYIQCIPYPPEGASGPLVGSIARDAEKYTVDQLRKMRCKLGGLYEGVTMASFLTTPSWARRLGVEKVGYHVWRKVKLASGTYRVEVKNSYRTHVMSWKLEVSGDQISGTLESDCCPGPRVDSLRGSINGDRVVIERDCSGQGMKGECHQVYHGTIGDGAVRGSFTGTGSAPNNFWTLNLGSRSN
jgi:hypothetical protein